MAGTEREPVLAVAQAILSRSDFRCLADWRAASKTGGAPSNGQKREKQAVLTLELTGAWVASFFVKVGKEGIAASVDQPRQRCGLHASQPSSWTVRLVDGCLFRLLRSVMYKAKQHE